MYAITGITGQVGGAVGEALLSDGCAVRAVARNPDRAECWTARGCTLAQAEITDAEALSAAFKDAEGVFIVVPPNFDPSPDFLEVRAVAAAVRAALERTRPDRVVMLSTVGAQASRPNLLNQLGLVERELAGLGLPIAFVRAAWFMENAAWDVQPAQAGAIHSFLQPLDRAIPMVATSDIGLVAAGLLRQKWTGKRVVELEGPARVSPNDLAATFADLLGHPVNVDVIPRAEWEALFRAQGMKNPIPRAQMLDGFNEGWISFDGDDTVETVRGKTTIGDVLSRLIAHNKETN